MKKANKQNLVYDNDSRLEFVRNFYGSKKIRLKKIQTDKTREHKREKRSKSKQRKRELVKNIE